LNFAKYFADLFDADLEFIHCSESGDFKMINDLKIFMELKKLCSVSERYKLRVVKTTDPAIGLADYSAQNEVGVLICIRRSRNIFSDFFHESVSGRLIMLSKVPLLIKLD
jgi:hypothetical protein